MNEKIGPIKYGDFRSHVHIRFDAPPVHESSEETAREIDVEVKKLIDEAHARALQILTDHRDELEKLATALLERETLSAAEIDVLLGRVTETVQEATPEESAAEEPAAPAENTPESTASEAEIAAEKSAEQDAQ